MLTGEIRSKIDALWNAFWSGGIANPLEVIEQITYLLFLKRLDDLHTLEENKAARLKLKKLERRVFPDGKDAKGRVYEDCRWSRFKHFEAKEMFEVVDQHVFPFLRMLGGDESTYAHHMKDARFTIPTPALLAKVVDMVDGVPMEDRDTKGDLYEYMLGKIASAGQNGQFRTPRHIIRLMVELTAPTAKDVICDPACGTAGFLVAAGEYLRERYPEILRDAKLKDHFHHHLFHGFDFDNTMLRIGSMNMLLHGVENPDIRYRDSLAQEHAGEEERYTLVLANPPFAGSLDYENCAKDLQQIVKTKKTELLFLALFLRLLKPGGRAAVIVPDGVLFGSSNAHKTLRKTLVEDQKLDAVISLPGGVFKPYAGVSTAILVFTKTNSGGTDHVWFYDVDADGWSLDDKRTELLPAEKLGPIPNTALTGEDHAKNNLPDILACWRSLKSQVSNLKSSEASRPRTAQSFLVPKADIATQGYDLSLNRYKEVIHVEVNHRPPGEILKNLAKLEAEIQQGMKELEGEAEMSQGPSVALDDLMATKSGSVDPSKFAEEVFDLYSIPAFDRGEPEVVAGSAIGSAKQVVEPGDVLLSKIVPHIRRAWVVGTNRGRRIIGSGEWIVFRSKNADPSYLRQVLVGDPFHTEFMNTVAGVGGSLLRARPAHVARIVIPLPPLPEQRRIAAILDQADSLRSRRRAALAELDTLTQSLFLDLFGDPISNPKHWPELEFGGVCERVTVGIVVQPASYYVPAGVPALRSLNIKPGKIILGDLVYFSTTDNETKLKKTRLKTGDLVLVRSGQPGTAAIVPRELDGVNAIDLLIATPRRELADATFLCAFFNSAGGRDLVLSRQRGQVQKHLNVGSLDQAIVPLPPLTLQREFARRVTAAEKLITAHRAHLSELDALFASLQHRAFRGDL